MSDPKFYAVGEREQLWATQIDDAVTEWLEECEEDFELPDHVMVQGYKEMELTEKHNAFGRALEELFETIGEEYDPMGETASPPPIEIEDAFKAFVKVFVEKYPIWSCEKCGDPIRVDNEDFQS